MNAKRDLATIGYQDFFEHLANGPDPIDPLFDQNKFLAELDRCRVPDEYLYDLAALGRTNRIIGFHRFDQHDRLARRSC